MVSYYDEIEIEDFTWDEKAKVYHTPCPCGDRFEITKSQLSKGVDVATCPSCSLIVRVVYDMIPAALSILEVAFLYFQSARSAQICLHA
ncbi:uncharacterized protein VP01_1011g10 [Puccinia sorghi]|uniref:Diphthamide biosynthesis protein 3 n=1 Tax=Puccinia sorghi TaxID=27349 RepID=A0A0L6VV13_9BASI|nr:uncharacterized protein VP01_1011g10 [Puccinia sorghi]